jgi:adenosine deaminase
MLRGEIARLPKAEVHVHLEGCFSRADLVELAAINDERLPASSGDLFEFHSFDQFLDFLSWSCGLLRTGGQVASAAYRFAERQARAGCVAADVIVNPIHWAAWRGRLAAFVTALDDGFSAAEIDGLPPVGICISLLRQQSSDEAQELVAELISQRRSGAVARRVVALSIDGNEQASGRVSARFADAFRRAGAAGFARTVHAGESSGPEGVRDAIELLGADRIDHGVRAIEDPSLVGLT